MIIRSMELETVCGITSTLPENREPEFAFAGKSNVGKSSLINALLQRKSFARTSSEPGKTQTINYYSAETDTDGSRQRIMLVDLPGYGYTKASPSSRESWGKMVERYLKLSKGLTEVFLLVDIRHEPGANDIQMFDWICANGYRPAVIATKLDKLSKKEAERSLAVIRKSLGLSDGDILIPFSSETKAGTEDIYSIIHDFMEASHDQNHNA